MNRDIFILAVSAVVIATCSFFLYLDFTARVKVSGAKKIGEITFKRKIAERKYSGQIMWEELSQKAPLYNNDSIRTAEGSLSIIKLKSGQVIELDENTLILLSMSDKGASIDFSRGSIAAKSTSPVSGLNITSAGTNVEVKSGGVNLSKKQDQSISMNVTSGKAVVKTDKGKQDVTSDQIVVFSKKSMQIKKKTIFLESPQVNRQFITAGSSVPVQMTWRAGGKRVVVEISRNSAFSTLVKSAVVSGNSFLYRLRSGSYYWRVRSAGKQREYSGKRKFFILKDTLAEAVSPSNNEQFTFLKKRPMINFFWTKSKLASSYQVVIAKDKAMKNIVKILNSTGRRIATDELGAGRYYWKIRHLYSVSGVKPVATPQTSVFIIKKKKNIAKPYLLSPVPGVKVSSLYLLKNHMLFNWKENSDMSGFVVFLSKDPKGKEVVVKASTRMNYYTFTGEISPGTYFWGVTGKSADGLYTSALRKLIIKKASPIMPVYPPHNGTVFFSATKGKVRYSWKDPNNFNSYRFVVSRDKSMNKILFSRTVKNNAVVYTAPHGGSYYWKVKLIDNKKKVRAESKTFTINLSERLGVPVGLSPVNKVIDMTARNSLTFVWKNVQGASHYKIRLYNMTSGSVKKVFERKVTRNMVSIRNMALLDKGRFAWDIQALNYHGNTLVSQSQVKKYSFSLTLRNEPTQKPEIINGGVIYTQ